MQSGQLKPVFEPLELRRCASVATCNIYAGSDGYVHVSGTANRDFVTLQRDKSAQRTIVTAYTKTDTDQSPTVTETVPDSALPSVPAGSTKLKGYIIELGNGTDTLRFAGTSTYPGGTSVENVFFDQVSAGNTQSTEKNGSLGSGDAAQKELNWRNAQSDLAIKVQDTDELRYFIGDSFVQRWTSTGKPAWTLDRAGGKSFDDTSINLGLQGDSTRQLLRRISNGEFGGATVKPTQIVLEIGTNNFVNPIADGTDAEIVSALKLCISKLKAVLPTTKIFFVSIPPKYYQLGTNERIVSVNQQMKDYASRGGYSFLDAYSTFFVNKNVNDKLDGTLYAAPITEHPNYDDVHLSEKGYNRFADTIADSVL